MMSKSYAFFFDANHQELDSLYGPPCTAKIVSAIELSELEVKTQILRGDLMPHLMAYKITSVSTESYSADGVRAVGHGMSPDIDLYKIILCDLADSLACGWHTINPIEFPFEIAQKSIWTIVLPTISSEIAEEIDTQTKSFNPYLGGACIDTGNPIHIELFTLIDGAYIDNQKFYYRREYEYEEDVSVAKSYGSTKPILTSAEDFSINAPQSLTFSGLSERGSLSVSRVEGKSTLSHGQRLAHELLEYLHENPDVEEVSYQAELNQEFLCEENKVKNYLLNLDHPVGGSKAKFFVENLGIQRDDWKYLADQISGAMTKAMIFRLSNNEHGISHGAFIEIQGRNNRTAIIQTGWIVEDGEAPRLITAYPHSEPVDAELEAPLQNISPVGLVGNARWADIYRRAHEAGEKAAHECTPTPMTVSGYLPIFAGACGYAWVTIPDVRKGMARWLKENGIGHKNYKSGWNVSAHPKPDEKDSWDLQSIEPKKAYAEAFGKVLLDNGVECKVESEFD